MIFQGQRDYGATKRRVLQPQHWSTPSWAQAGVLSPEFPTLSVDKRTHTVELPNSYSTPLVGYKLLARGKFILCNQIINSNNTIINDFTLLDCAGFDFFSGANCKSSFDSLSLNPASFPPRGGTELLVRSSSADGFAAVVITLAQPLTRACSVLWTMTVWLYMGRCTKCVVRGNLPIHSSCLGERLSLVMFSASTHVAFTTSLALLQ